MGFRAVLGCIALAACACTPRPPAPGSGCELALRVDPAETWTDPSPHRCGTVQAAGLRLHYLDWGGKGEAIVFLPGLGSSAHVFDDFAPRFTDRFRVLALTPAAHGESATPDSGRCTVDDVASAVVGLLDSLHIARAHLVGQSISGATITRFAIQYPDRVRKLVYMDGTFDYGGADEAEMDRRALPRPQPAITSAAEHRDWTKRYFLGTWTDALEADMWAGNMEAEEGERRAKARSALLVEAIAHPKDYTSVRAPALAIWAQKTLETHYFWLDRADTAAVARATYWLENHRRPWEQKGVDRFRREARAGRVVAFPAHHWMFVTEPERTCRELRAFLLEQ